MYHALAFGQKRDGSNISEWVIIKRFTRGIYSLTEKIKGEGLMKRRRQAAESQEKGVQAVRLRLADIYGGMISSRLKEDAALPVLAQSIARHGLLQPIVVQENEENGRYMLDRRSADSGEKAGRGRVFSGRPFYPADGPFFEGGGASSACRSGGKMLLAGRGNPAAACDAQTG